MAGTNVKTDLNQTNLAASGAANDALTATNTFGGATKGFTFPKDDFAKVALFGIGAFVIYQIFKK